MTNLQASRTRVITWEDPIAAVQTGKTISGIAYLKALQSGELPPPPIAVLMDMWITEVSEGRVVFAAEPAEYHYNPLGTVHGGVMATLFDTGARLCRTIYAPRRNKLYHARTQGQLSAAHYSEDRNGVLRGEDHSPWRTHCHRRWPLDRRWRQAVCAWDDHVHHLAPINSLWAGVGFILCCVDQL